MTALEEDAPEQIEVAPEVLAAEESRNDATTGLKLYKRQPPGIKGVELLNHMTKFSMRAHKGSPSKYGISSHLAIACPATKHQRNLVSIIPHQNTMKDLMDDVNAGISLKKAIRSRMNNLAEIGGRSGLINSDERNQRLKEHLQLLASQAEIAETTNAAKASKKKAAQSDLSSILPEAPHLYDSVDADIDSTAFPRAFTKKFAEAILFLIFGVTMSASTKKQDMIDPPSSPDSDEEVHVPTTAAARSMSGYLYRWSLRSHPENARDLA